MPKTTRGDGMERRAEKWLVSVGATDSIPDAYQRLYVVSLTRLLRKVAREAAKKQREDSAMEAHNWLCKHGICDGTVLVVDAIRKAKVSA